MNGTASLLAIVFVGIAVFDWVAVHAGRKAVRLVTKPGCMLALIAAAAAMDPTDDAARTALVVALILSTIGDVFLLGGSRPTMFVAGLASFLLAHLAYVAGFWLDDVGVLGILAGVLLGTVLLGTVGVRVVAGAKAAEEPALAGPVRAYVLVISTMVVSATGTGDPRAILGAALFATSDSLIGWSRFVRHHDWHDVAIITTYHVAQLLLVLSFAF